MFEIDFEPIGRRSECDSGQSIMECARQFGISIVSICGSQGKCCSCKVQVVKGAVSEPTSHERDCFSSHELQQGWRLACQVFPKDNCKINIPAESMSTPQRTQVEGLEITLEAEPAVQAYQLELQAPTLADVKADADSLLETLQKQNPTCNRIDLEVLHDISSQLREWNWQCQASVRNDEVIAISQPKSLQSGLAIDLGTTKIAGYLVDLSDGRTIAARGIMNPQISYGEDVISRITHASTSPENSPKLQSSVVEAIEDLADELCSEAGIEKDRIVDVVVVGNTAMHHLFLRLPAKQLALSPFAPALSSAFDVKARDIGLHMAPGTYVHLLPNIAGFVGADHVAMLLATEAWKAEGITIALDIGTNTEVSLIDNGKITTVSCASGPAFEGGHIKQGMRAASGAVERVRIVNNSVQYQTIDEGEPIGICGSGILDAMAQLYIAGIINERGRIIDNHPDVHDQNDQREFVLVKKKSSNSPDIVITQGDVRELQLAKAAMRTGIQMLLKTNNRSEEEIDQVIIAGAFGTYIDVSSAIAIGMLPSLPLERFHQVGNAAGMGAKMALVSLQKRKQARDIASKVNYIELGSAPNFTQTYIQSGYLGQYRLSQGKRTPIP
jgi:uncharacterized 2Fe-2S/4Fe-4S cluster protein (DUF4445 family)